jgi:hypothetical protein
MLESPALLQPRSSAERLNQRCFCRTLNLDRLREHLEVDYQLNGMVSHLTTTRPHLFSSTAVFISHEIYRKIVHTVTAIERVIALPAYRTQALSRAPDIAQRVFGPLGVCMGFDFHIGTEGPRLIEINTNAGGAIFNAALARAQEACCVAMEWAFIPKAGIDRLDQTYFDMFINEWFRQRGDAPLKSILIVDDAPADQYLAPEFELYQRLFQKNGLSASIADPSELFWHEGELWHQNTKVDMIYNRLTDFYLKEPTHQALRLAYEAGAVVLTPNPYGHAMYADKRNLIALSQDELLTTWGVSTADRKLLKAGIPQTQLVTTDRADELWAQRRQLFFKPVAGYGAKAAYRGDKLTRRVWNEILTGDFVAQALVPPSERLIEVDGVLTELKFDLRAYTYAGQVQLLAARIYTGQTTNFRTQGGGFAPVIVVPPVEIDTNLG